MTNHPRRTLRVNGKHVTQKQFKEHVGEALKQAGRQNQLEPHLKAIAKLAFEDLAEFGVVDPPYHVPPTASQKAHTTREVLNHVNAILNSVVDGLVTEYAVVEALRLGTLIAELANDGDDRMMRVVNAQKKGLGRIKENRVAKEETFGDVWRNVPPQLPKTQRITKAVSEMKQRGMKISTRTAWAYAQKLGFNKAKKRPTAKR